VPFGRSLRAAARRGAARSDPSQDKKRPALDDNLHRTAGYRFHCLAGIPLLVVAPERIGHGHRTSYCTRFPAFWPPEGLWFVGLKSLGAGLTDRESLTPWSVISTGRRVTSGLAAARWFLHSWTAFRPHSGEAEFLCLGMQSYSRSLCLSRGKHYRLYP